jgi:hypothetical protein
MKMRNERGKEKRKRGGLSLNSEIKVAKGQK